MAAIALLAIHFLVLFMKLLMPGGIKSVIAPNPLLKQQLIVMGRSRLKAPNLTLGDRFIFGYLSLFISARRRLMSAVIVKPSTLSRFHRALLNRKYSRLFSNRGKTLQAWVE